MKDFRLANDEPLLGIVYRDVDELKPDPKNARIHSKKQIHNLVHIIKALGFNVPVLIDQNLNIVSGHGRIQAAKLAEIRQVPTITLAHLNKSQIRAFMLADNRIAELATWDEQLLAEQLRILELELNFDLELTGFEMGEIDVMLQGDSSAAKEDDPADDLGDATSGPGVTKIGDVWSMGRHRIVCADALDGQTYSVLMENRRADAVFTDPPYNVPIEGFVTRSRRARRAPFAMAFGEMSKSEFKEFLRKSFCQMERHSVPGALNFIFMDWRHSGELLSTAEGVFGDLVNLCIWVKQQGGQGSFYRSQHELVFVFKTGKEKHRNNVELGRFGRYRTNVWQYSRPNSVVKTDTDSEFTALHPTVKPVRLASDAILDCTARGDIVLDPFLGSGTTLVAAERVGRACFGIELTPAFVDLAVRRWQTLTGQAAIHVHSSRTFRECEEVSIEKQTN